MSSPPPDDLDRAVAFLRGVIEAGGRALVHCGAGYGRTGTVIACYLVAQGMTDRLGLPGGGLHRDHHVAEGSGGAGNRDVTFEL